MKNISIALALTIFSLAAIATARDVYFYISKATGSTLPPSEGPYFEESDIASTSESGEVTEIRLGVVEATGQRYVYTVCSVPCNKPETPLLTRTLTPVNGEPTTPESGSPLGASSQGPTESDEAYSARMKQRQSLRLQLSDVNATLGMLTSQVSAAEQAINSAIRARNTAASEKDSARFAKAAAKSAEADAKLELSSSTAVKQKLEADIAERQDTLNNKRSTRNKLLEKYKSNIDKLDTLASKSSQLSAQASDQVTDFIEDSNSAAQDVLDGSRIEELEEEADITTEEVLAAAGNLETEYEFQTDKSSEHYFKLHAVQKRVESTRKLVETDQSNNKKEREALVESAGLANALADTAYSENDPILGDQYLSVAVTALDLASDFVPGVSFAKDSYKIYTGYDPFTGEAISDTERTLIAGSLFLPSVVSGSIKGITKLGRHLSKISKKGGWAAALASKLKDAMKRSDESVAEWVGSAPCVRGASNFNPLHWIKDLVDPKAFACPPLGTNTGKIAASTKNVKKVNGRRPLNSKFAGRTFSFDLSKNPIQADRFSKMSVAKQEAKIQEFERLNRKYPEGVKFSDEGYPIFDPYVLRREGKTIEKDIGKLNPDRINPDTGKISKSGSDIDMEEANKLVREDFPDWVQPKGTTWHHIENSSRLQLVPTDLHQTVKHTGGRATFKN